MYPEIIRTSFHPWRRPLPRLLRKDVELFIQRLYVPLAILGADLLLFVIQVQNDGTS